MSVLVTVEAAREWMRVRDEASDDLIINIIDTAEGIVFGFLGRPISGTGSWPTAEVPAPVINAIKTVAAAIYDNRGGIAVSDDELRALVGGWCKPDFA